jgi:membrane protease YdiL (CAAX protease family)
MERLEPMLPHTRAELALFLKLALTAGVCEELLFRGYMIWYLSHWLPIYPAAGLASLLFGIGHIYQGWRGVLTTGMVGAFLAAVFLLTGSLFAGMAIHALMDAHSGQLMQAAYERERALAAAEPATGEQPA